MLPKVSVDQNMYLISNIISYIYCITENLSLILADLVNEIPFIMIKPNT